MGMVKTEITLKNARDEGNAQDGLIKTEAVRSVTITAIADTGAMYPVINEDLCQKLGLAYREERIVHVADGQSIRCKTTEAVDVCWKDRNFVCPTIVIPGSKYVLLGAIALEGMDIVVNPVTQELEGAHGDEAVIPLLSYTM